MALELMIPLIEIFTACILFGTVFVPIKRFNPGDGMFSQFLMCMGIFVVGFGTFAMTQFQGFYPLAMAGGVVWCIGNLTAIPIITELGLGMAILIFSVTNCLVNFVVGAFGLFGTTPRPPNNVWLSIVGLIAIIVGGIGIAFVKTKPSELLAQLEQESENNSARSEKSIDEYGDEEADEKDAITSTSGKKSKFRRSIALVFALLSGILYGLVQVPIIAIQDHPEIYPGSPKKGLPYIFSHYTGILMTSTIAFLVYTLIKKNRPVINPKVAFPSFCSGLMWGIGMTTTIVCTERLSQTITGPISGMVPGCVATVWSLFYFREIETGKNLIVLWTAVGVTIIGALLIGVSSS